MDEVFATLTAVAVAFGPLAMADTKLVDMLRNMTDIDDNWPKWTWNIAAFVIGVGVCLLWQLNVMEPLVAQVPALSGADLSGFPGELITGLGVGAFASYWHENMDLKSSRAKGKASG